MQFSVFSTAEFDRLFKKLDTTSKSQIKKQIEILKINPYSGKPLGYRFLREKKIRGLRLYYLIYKKDLIIILAGLSDKKTQSSSIQKIIKLLPYFKSLMENKR